MTDREQELLEHIAFLEGQLRYAMKILYSMMTQIEGLSEVFKNDFKFPDENAPPRHEQH
jgi:hypothetical protein